jgi:hypothetical protein
MEGRGGQRAGGRGGRAGGGGHGSEEPGEDVVEVGGVEHTGFGIDEATEGRARDSWLKELPFVAVGGHCSSLHNEHVG